MKGKARKLRSPAATGMAGRWQTVEAAVAFVFFLLIAVAFSLRIQIQFTLPKLACLFFGATVFAVLWARRSTLGRIKAVPRGVLVPALLLLAWWGITTLFAADPRTALFGMHGRYNGLITQAGMLGLFLAFASAEMSTRDVRGLVTIMIAALLPATAYAAAQELGHDWFVWPNPRPASTFGHPVPLAATMGLVVPFALSFLLTASTSWARWAWAGVLGLLLFATAATLSRGPWVGVALAVVVVIAAAHRRGVVNLRAPAARWIAVLAVALLALPVNSEVLSRFSLRIRQLAQLNEDPSFSGRFVFFDAAYRMALAHPVTGVGLESFGILYPQYRRQEPEHIPADSVPTMVHNGYLQAAATTGLPGLALYLVLIGGVAFVIVRPLTAARSSSAPAADAMTDQDWMFGIAFLAGLAGYMVQDASGWQEVSLSVYFWVLAGAGVSFATAGAVRHTSHQRFGRWLTAIAMVCGVAAAAMGMWTLRSIGVDAAFFESQLLDPNREWTRIQQNLAAGLRGAPDDSYYLDTAGVFYLKRLHSTGERDAFDRATALFDRARAENRFDPYILVHQLDLQTAALQRKLLVAPVPFGDQLMRSMIDLDPNNASVHETAARYLAASGRAPEGMTAIDRAIALRPSHPRFHALRGDLLRAMKDHAGAAAAYREETARVLAGGPEWRVAKRKLLVTLAESGRQQELIDEARAATKIAPDDDIAFTMLGLAHQLRGELELAKAAFAEALRINPGNTAAAEALRSVPGK